MNKLFLLLGKTSSGKDSVLQSLLPKMSSLNIETLPSCTTRPIRANEIQGREYYFTTLKEFDKLYKDNQIAEYAIYNVGESQNFWCYFTLKSDMDKLNHTNLIGIKNPLGYSQLCGGYKDKIVTILLDCPEDIIRKRYIERGATDDKLEDRIARDNKDFKYLNPNHTVLNDGSKTIDEVSDEVLEIIKSYIEV